MKKFLVFIAVTMILGFFPKQISAAGQFDTEYYLTYEINPSGQTSVNQNIKITNIVNDVIPTNYSLTLRQLEVSDIRVSSNKNQITPELIEQNSETAIKIKFQNQQIGVGKVNELDISYNSPSLAAKSGDVWNVYIPQVTGLTDIKTYDLSLIVPKQLGPKIFISPQPDEETDLGDAYRYLFKKEKLKASGISASFGRYQTINFNLKYELQNNSYFWTEQEIALPPEIVKRQQILIKQITPEPKYLKEDLDGNLIAVMGISPKQSLSVEVIGTAKILGRQIELTQGGFKKDIPIDLITKYTKTDKYWDVSSPEIQEIAQSLYEPDKNILFNTQKVYEFVVENLDYDFGVLNQDSVLRKGAKEALNNTVSSACMEFTDLFISITRAMGIPARELNGYAFTNDSNSNPLSISFKNSDFLHAWPEFYDPNLGWTAVDPTWGNTSGLDYFTKMDTNHFVFVVKGLDSESPLPAGAYRYDNNSKQVDVSFSQSETDFFPELTFKKVISFDPTHIVKGKTLYQITNSSGAYALNIEETSKNILPYQSAYISLNDLKDFSYKDFNQNKYYLNPQLEPGFTFWISPLEVTYLVLAVIALCTIVYFARARLKAQQI